MIQLAATDINTLAVALEEDFFADIDLMQVALQTQSSFHIIHLPTMIKTDLFVMLDTPFACSEMNRRIRLPLFGAGEPLVYVASAEDMILQKLHWYRLTGERSDRQWGDVQGMLKVQGDALDFPYLDCWAKELGISDLLPQSLKDAGL